MPESIDTSLVRIHTKAGGVAGAGFLVAERHILTCAHVIAQALGLADDTPDLPSSTVSLDFPQLASRTLLTAEVDFWYPIQADGRGDIAGLKLLDDPPAGAEAVPFAPAEQVWYHSFRALGFPSGYDDGVFATGRLLGRLGTNWIQIEDVKVPGFAIIAGFSGAPVWDEQLQGVVGMIVASSQQAAAKVAFVIPYDVLVEAWPDLLSFMRQPVPRNPYKGLHAFTEHDAGDFFGRDRLIEELVTAVSTALTREQQEGQYARMLAVVLGPSGSGKSSVVMAGLIPHLRAGKVLNSNEWVYLDPIVPGTDPLEALTITLKSHFPDTSFKTLREDLEGDTSNGLYLLATQLVKKKEAKVVLLVDQFEEAFTLVTAEAQRQHFFDLLVTAVTEPRSPLFVILTLRADFYDRPMQYPELYRLIDNHHVSVLPLERDDLRRVIEQPAKLKGVQLTFKHGLVDELLMDMQGQSGALPLLEFTLDQLFQRRNGYELTLEAYHEMGGIKGALSQHAEETYQALPSDAHRQAARAIFSRLIEPGTTEQDTTRRRADRSEFERADPIQAQQMRETLEAFIRARLLTINQVGGKTTIEVSHEALIREWKRLAEWLREARDDILFQQSLSEDVAEWEQRKRPRDRLYRGDQLKEAQKWAKHNIASEQEAAFLRASATQRTLSLVSIIVVVLLLASSLGIAGWFVFFQPSKTLVTTLQDNNGVGSLRWCITNAPSGSTIRFAQGLSGIIELTGDLVFAGGKSLTIAGPGTNQLTISGINAKIHISKGATLTISDLSFKNSETVIDAFLFNEGSLTMTNSIISGNKTTVNSTSGGLTTFGGGIENVGMLTVKDSIISNNSSIGEGGLGEGGGIYNKGTGILIVTKSIISNNAASSTDSGGYGGGISNEGTLTLANSIISGNKASGPHEGVGGGIYNTGTGTLRMSNTTISNNSASSSGSDGLATGGGITNDSKSTLIVTASTFASNLASGVQGAIGGGIDNESNLIVTQSTFSHNSSSSSNSNKSGGGGIANFGTLTAINSTFADNSTEGKQESYGGGIYYNGVKGFSDIIRFCTFYKNSSRAGGGIFLAAQGNRQITLSSNIIAANSASAWPDIAGALISGGYNLIGNVAGATGLNASTDRQVSLADLKIDSPLSNHGGPTQTLALLQGSQAIDAVPLQACNITVIGPSGQHVTITTDQRGDARPDGSENACDVGAYESSY